MGNIALRVEGLGKQYRIGGKKEKYRTFREALIDVGSWPRQVAASWLRQDENRVDNKFIWALKDVSFEAKHGEIIGIIGRNGAGKTTLLKILSRITEPTRGCVDIFGRVGSLLEVGTGFHYELTGRENIYLNGAILGMKRSEIERKFDEIVAFAEVERFLDTPVKHYSSGMYLRLAFAVAAHLEPEILLIDEVLAVGDIDFQKKCLSKMGNVAESGRTVLFVSHNMAAVKGLCRRGVLLNNGILLYDGDIGQTLTVYQQHLHDAEGPQPHEDFDFLDIRLNEQVNQPVDFSSPLSIDFVLHTQLETGPFRLLCILRDTDARNVVWVETDQCRFPQIRKPGQYRIRLQLPALWLTPGTYSLSLQFQPTGSFGMRRTYVSDSMLIDGVVAHNCQVFNGVLCPDHEWDMLDIISGDSTT